jgi:hypothetical protein
MMTTPARIPAPAASPASARSWPRLGRNDDDPPAEGVGAGGTVGKGTPGAIVSGGWVEKPGDEGLSSQRGDRLEIPSSTEAVAFRYSIYGPRLYDCPNPLGGMDFGYYWVRAEALV